MLTERDALVAIFNAVTALAERLTGERMCVSVEMENGQTICLSGGTVQWNASSAFPAVAALRPDAR